ncbi:asparagine synthase [Candidatus Woesearchaeota archaeon]|nr:asparagine synthase [Candidatus Woesearchaeota archaeon]
MERFRDLALPPELKKPLAEIKEELKELIIASIKKNTSKKKFGILFSGGIDSTVIAFICKRLCCDFICCTASLEEDGLKPAEDLIYAEKVSRKLGFELKTIKVKLDDVEEIIKEIIRITDSSNVVTVGVALPLYLAMKEARKVGCDVVFSGLGSEEIFAGYERHRKSKDINEECVNGLKNIHEKDISRDLALAEHFGIEVKIPFLDNELVEYSLKIPAKYKMDDKHSKLILRMVASDLGIPDEFAYRKKKAAQYGSNFDKAIAKLAKKNGYRYKSQYLTGLR